MRYFYLFVFLLAFINSYAQLKWEDTQGPEGGAFLELYVHGDSTYAASHRSVYKYVNDSIQWKEIAQGNFHRVESNGEKAFSYYNIKEGEYLLTFSNDKSQTWDTLMILQDDSIHIDDITLDSMYYYVNIWDRSKRRDFLLRTKAPHTRWDTIFTASVSGITAYENRIFVHNWDTLLYSDDHGLHFHNVKLPSKRLGSAQVVAKGDMIGIGTDNRLYYTRDLGKTAWRSVPGNYDSNPPHLTISHNNDLYAEYFDRLFKVHNFGNNISTYNIDYEKVAAFSLAPLNETIITNNWIIGIYKWSHEERAFIPSFKGIQEAVVSDMDTIGNTLYTSSMSGIYKYNMISGEWSGNIFPYHIPQFSYLETNSRGWIVLGFGFESYFYLSKDRGNSWKKFNPDALSFGLTAEPYLLMDTILFRKGDQGRLIRSTNPLKADSIVEGIGLRNQGVQNVNGKLYVSYDSKLFISADTGISWTERKMNFRIYYIYTTENYLLLSSRNPDRSKKVYYLDQNNEIKEMPLPIKYYFSDPFFTAFEFNKDFFLSIDGKIYRTSNMGQDWSLFSNGNPSTYVFNVDSLLFASNNGIFRSKIPLTTSTKNISSPQNFLSYLCYPNPTAGVVNIEFEQLPPKNMQLHVISRSGKVVYQKSLKGFTKSHRFNLSSLPSGVYYMLFSNGNYRLPASKIILLNR
jgi:hypothetical protein